ncbi:MAG: hypothetical protein ACLR8P_16520 [Clostridium fessum]
MCGAFGRVSTDRLKKQPFAYGWQLAVFWRCWHRYRRCCRTMCVYESFWGNDEGRFSGLFLITLYVLGTIVISKCWSDE